MKAFDTTIRFSVNVALALAFFFGGLSANAEAHPAGKAPVVPANLEKHVHIKVEIHGKIDGHTADAVEDLIADWLEAAHFVVEETEGANFLKLHVVLKVTGDNHFAIHEDCGDWQEEKEAAVLDALDDILHHMINDFIEKFDH
jgi:hypothetical protein